MASLAAVLVYTGWKLVNPKALLQLWRVSRPEGVIAVITMVLVVGLDLLAGHFERGREVAGLDQLAEASRPGDVGALADVHERDVVGERERLESRQLQPRGALGHGPRADPAHGLGDRGELRRCCGVGPPAGAARRVVVIGAAPHCERQRGGHRHQRDESKLLRHQHSSSGARAEPGDVFLASAYLRTSFLH